MLGWWAHRARTALFYYTLFQLVAWFGVLGLFSGPAGIVCLPLLVIASIASTASLVVEFVVATMHLAKGASGALTDLESSLWWGWGTCRDIEDSPTCFFFCFFVLLPQATDEVAAPPGYVLSGR